MQLKDVILIILVVFFMIVIFYFNIWRHRKEPCHGCPYAKKCTQTCNKKKRHK